jgi:elongation of very long chain fatty acids protein 4
MSPDSVKPVNLEAAKFVYNPMQIILCSYMCVEAGVQAYRNGYNVVCNDFKYDNPPLANLLWLFYISKVFDFADTVFIVLGKKWKQLSFLHVYHHTSIFLMYWLNLRVGFDGDIYLTIILNGYIHTIMYTYYFVSQHMKDPKTGKPIPIWWKKYLTGAQLTQFTLMNLQAGYLLYTGCSQFPKQVTTAYLIYIQTLFWLFMQFFVSSYMSGKKGKDGDKKGK